MFWHSWNTNIYVNLAQKLNCICKADKIMGRNKKKFVEILIKYMWNSSKLGDEMYPHTNLNRNKI